MSKRCQRCGEEEDELRILKMACGFELEPYVCAIVKKKVEFLDEKSIYTLDVCKECHRSWMNTIRSWFYVREYKYRPKCFSSLEKD